MLQRPAEVFRGKVTLLDTDYADDTALMDSTKDGLQETTDLLCNFAVQAGVRISERKPEVMVVANISQRPYTEEGAADISVEGSLVQQVSNFTYVGVVISSDGSKDRELSARIWKSFCASNQISNAWKYCNIQTNVKIRTHKVAILGMPPRSIIIVWRYFVSAA